MNKVLKKTLQEAGCELRAAELRTSYDVLRDGHNGGTTFARAGKVTKVVRDEMALTRLSGTVVCFISRGSDGWGARYCTSWGAHMAQEPEHKLSNSYAYSHESLSRVVRRMT